MYCKAWFSPTVCDKYGERKSLQLYLISEEVLDIACMKDAMQLKKDFISITLIIGLAGIPC